MTFGAAQAYAAPAADVIAPLDKLDVLMQPAAD